MTLGFDAIAVEQDISISCRSENLKTSELT
jgi:hypothetical protein